MVKKAKKLSTKKDRVEEIASLLFDRTEKWAKSQGLLKEKKSKYSTKAKKFDKLISKGNFGCQEQGVRDLISELIGEKVPPKKNEKFEIEFLHGVVIVPLSGVNSSYEIGEPILIKNIAGGAIRMDGTQPNARVEVKSTNSIRPASIEEIEELMKSLLKIDSFDSLLLGMILDKMGGS